MTQRTPQHPASVPASGEDRRMVRAELMGAHSHSTLCGVQVHIWQRSGAFLARGRYQRQPFGETLGGNLLEATARLRQILTEIEAGSYLRPSEARKRPLSAGTVPRLSVRQLVSEFLAEKRKVLGRRTAATYRSRLRPVLDFAEQPAVRTRWPLARDIDRNFVVELRAYLTQYTSTRNGRAGGRPRFLSGRQVINILECLHSVLAWARLAEVWKLPAGWPNPVTADLIGSPAPMDPLREDPLPLESRVRLVDMMDRWQLCQRSLSVLLPLRPEEAAGLLIGDVDFARNWFTIGTRLDGGDFTKAHTSFVLPFPPELRPILVACIGGRSEGPLLQSRKVFEGRSKVRQVSSFEELARIHQEKLARAPRESVLTPQDRKEVFRDLLRELGGVSEDQLAREMKGLLTAIGAGPGVTLYTLRGSVTRTMEQARLPHLELRYLTSHSVSDILNEYVGLAPAEAMKLYFTTIQPLLDAVARRSHALGTGLG